MKKCETCKYFHATPLEAKSMGQCRKNTPTVFVVMSQNGPSILAAWAPVQETHFCGQHREKEANLN